MSQHSPEPYDSFAGNVKVELDFFNYTTASDLKGVMHNDAYIVVKGTITVPNTAAADENANNFGKKVIFKNCVPFADCISEINNTQVDNAEDIDAVMPMYNLIEYSNNYSKTSGSLWQYWNDIPTVNNNCDNDNFNEANFTDSFEFKEKKKAKQEIMERNNGTIKTFKQFFGELLRCL